MKRLNSISIGKGILFLFIAYYFIGAVATIYFGYTHQNHMVCIPPKGIAVGDPNYKCPVIHESFITVARDDVMEPYFWLIVIVWPALWQGVE